MIMYEASSALQKYINAFMSLDNVLTHESLLSIKITLSPNTRQSLMIDFDNLQFSLLERLLLLLALSSVRLMDTCWSKPSCLKLNFYSFQSTFEAMNSNPQRKVNRFFSENWDRAEPDDCEVKRQLV